MVGEDKCVYYRVNDEGQFYYRCVIDNTEHPITNTELARFGLQPIVAETLEIKKLPKPPPERNTTDEVMDEGGLI